MQSLISTAVSALDAYSLGMNTTADNIANINTPHFKAGRAFYETGPQGFGVQVGEISRDTSPGPAIPALPADTYTPGTEAYASYREGSNVSLEKEFTSLVMIDNSYSANAVAIQTYDQMAGTIINMKV